ncbi:MAG TPA: hypothetical protein VNG51_24780 [Ktedonobacteraceae bacterium]|nr:hypothetical protein [Ktedonobacteraceae bacterium]
MSMNMPPAVYWYKNQVAVTFYYDLPASSPVSAIIASVTDHQNELNSLLQGTNFTLKAPGGTMPPQQPSSMHMNQGSTPVASGEIAGIYV